MFSCGGTLARLAGLGWRVIVATVFTRSVPAPSGFALACQLDKGLSADIDYMALRRAEEVAACAACGAEAVFLPFAEAPHRGYGSAAALFGDPHAADDIALPVAAALRTLFADIAPDLVLAPQAIGGHVDHVQTVRAIDAVGARAIFRWWRDFPYVARHAAARSPFGARFGGPRTVAVPIDLAGKEAACAAYASQIGFQFGGRDGLRHALVDAGHAEILSHDAGVVPAGARRGACRA